MSNSKKAGSVRSKGIVPTTAPVVAPAPITPAASAVPTPMEAKGFRLQIEQMLAGVQSVLPVGSGLSTIKGPLTQAGMLSALQLMSQAYQAVDSRVSDLEQERHALEAQLPAFRAEYATFKTALSGFLGDSPLLAQFGIKVRGKGRVLTVQQNAVKLAKAAATRKLRGTLGSKQKAAIKYTGELQVTVGPKVDPATVAAPAAPAPAAATAAPVTPAAGATGNPKGS